MVDTILFIGAGRMGAPMAQRLAAAGYRIAVADLATKALKPFAEAGHLTAASAANLPGDVVITMLPTGDHVRDALLGPEGACTIQPRAVVIDMSSASPESTRTLAAELEALGTALLDAPVSGGIAGAAAGTLTAMVGGPKDAYDQAQSILRALCSKIFHVGPSGAGHIVKALNNYLSAATLWTATEALLIGQSLGLDAAAMLEVWDAGSGKSHATAVKLPDHVLTGTYDFGQTLALFCKDIAIAADLAAEARQTAPALAAILQNWRIARDTLGGDCDITEILHFLKKEKESSSFL